MMAIVAMTMMSDGCCDCDVGDKGDGDDCFALDQQRLSIHFNLPSLSRGDQWVSQHDESQGFWMMSPRL